MKTYASEHCVELAQGYIYMSPAALAHAMREKKQNDGVAVKPESVVSFLRTRRKMDLYYDRYDNLYLYVDEATKGKFVLHPNYMLKNNRKRKRRVCFITASKLRSTENFRMDKRRYEKIQ